LLDYTNFVAVNATVRSRSLPFPRPRPEIRYYEAKKLLNADTTKAAYTAILGQQRGAAMAAGDPAERRRTLEGWLEDGSERAN
jgi:hypothetical protein